MKEEINKITCHLDKIERGEAEVVRKCLFCGQMVVCGPHIGGSETKGMYFLKEDIDKNRECKRTHMRCQQGIKTTNKNKANTSVATSAAVPENITEQLQRKMTGWSRLSTQRVEMLKVAFPSVTEQQMRQALELVRASQKQK